MLNFRRPNMFDLRQARIPDGHHAALRLSEISLWWPYGTEGVPYPREYDADWSGEEWVFPDVAATDHFAGLLAQNGIRVVAPAQQLEVTASPLITDESWWQVSIPFVRDAATVPCFAQCAVPANDPTDALVAMLSSSELAELSATVSITRQPNPDALASLPPLTAEPHGWRLAVDVTTHPLALRIAAITGNLPPAQTPWKTPPLWDGVILSTRAQWPKLASLLEQQGIVTAPVPPLVLSPLAGRASTAPAWDHLHEYQKEDLTFLLDHDLRGILGDEMGLGKTAVGVSAAEVAHAQRVLVLGPLSALGTWETEIRTWAGALQKIQVLRDKTTDIAPDTRWLIMTHDMLAIRSEAVVVDADPEADGQALLARIKAAFGPSAPITFGVGKRGWTMVWDTPIPLTKPGELNDPALAQKIEKANQRLAGAFLAKLSAWQPDLILADEAHALKNWSAKRTQALRHVMGMSDRSAVQPPRILFLSGTPLRNTAKDAESYIRFLDPAAMEGRTKLAPEEAHDYFQVLMIRHRMDDVLPSMPPWIRQDVKIPVNATSVQREIQYLYLSALEYAADQRIAALLAGATPAEARQAELPGLTTARRYLGIMKALSSESQDLIQMIVSEKGRVVVFTHHHEVADELTHRLTTAGYPVVTVDGRVGDDERKARFAQFQAGEATVAIVGIQVAESVSLVRADTVVFMEYDWTPAAMQQAESRIRRIGQEAEGCHVITTVADFGQERILNLDREVLHLLRDKAEGIARVYGEVPEWASGVGAKNSSIQSALLDRVSDALARVPQDQSVAIAAQSEQEAAAKSVVDVWAGPTDLTTTEPARASSQDGPDR